MTLSHPAAVLERLAQIEHDLGERQNEYEEAAGARARLIRDWEKRLAIATAKAKGGDANARKQAALVMAAEQDDLYQQLTDAEATYAACQAVMRVLETRASVGQSILRSQGRNA
jgi:hypothetical protein